MSIVKNIYLKKDNFILDVPSIELKDEGITLLSGPSGSGKTLFLKVLMGFEVSQKEASWDFKGEDLFKLSPPQRKLGVVFQDLELFPHLTAQENILFHAQARAIQKKIYESDLQKMSQVAGIEHILNKKTNNLSGGEKQRVAILRALVGAPRILLLDEPFSSLDTRLKNDLRAFLQEIINLKKSPCLLVSHDEEDKKIASKIIYIEKGVIVS